MTFQESLGSDTRSGSDRGRLIPLDLRRTRRKSKGREREKGRRDGGGRPSDDLRKTTEGRDGKSNGSVITLWSLDTLLL